MERNCPSCGTLVEDPELVDCPACGASLASDSAAEEDLFEDLGDFGDLGTNDFIPLPGQSDGGDAGGEVDLDDLFGDDDAPEPAASVDEVSSAEDDLDLAATIVVDGEERVPLPSSNPPQAVESDDSLDLDGFFDDDDDGALIALPGTGEASSLEEEDLDALFGDVDEAEAPAPVVKRALLWRLTRSQPSSHPRRRAIRSQALTTTHSRASMTTALIRRISSKRRSLMASPMTSASRWTRAMIRC